MNAKDKKPPETTLADQLLLIGIQGRSGELMIESGNNIGSLLCHEGKIMLAFSPYTRAIGDLLVEQGVLTDAELLDVLKQQRTGPHTPLGSILLNSGKVTFATIESMVHDQVRMSIKEFQSWEPAEYHFVRKAIQPFDSIHLPIHEFLPPETIRSLLSYAVSIANAPRPGTKP